MLRKKKGGGGDQKSSFVAGFLDVVYEFSLVGR